MLVEIVRLSLQHPRLLALGALLFTVYGGLLLSRAEFEVFPEFVPAQANVQAEAPGFSAAQVEQLVTQPIEDVINGATGVESVRSKSIQGLAVIDIVFRDGEDPYRARQIVAERLSEVAGRLPKGVSAPTISALTSSTMDLLKVGLVSDEMSPMALRDLAQWTVRPRLLAVPGVARVTLYGGGLPRIEVRVRNAEMLARGLSLADVTTAVQIATSIRGGGFVDTNAQRIMVEPQGAAVTADELAATVVAPGTHGSPILLGDVADVVDAATPRFGDALIMGRPGVLLTLASQYGANTLDTTRAVEVALHELKPTFDGLGVTVYPALHRPANFIETALAGVRGDLLLGAVLITVVLLGFTRDLRVAFMAFVSIPLSLLAAVMVFEALGRTIDTMVLGGLAVALGVVIDDAVIGTENIVRRLREAPGRSTREVILDAAVEVRGPVVYATFVLGLTMAPVLFLTGLQGAFFSPLAGAFLLATFASLAVATTLTPALALLLIGHAMPPAEPQIVHALKRWHLAVLRPLMRRPRVALGAMAGIGLLALLGFSQFGAELLPAFRERHYVLAVIGPSGASLEWMREIGTRISRDLLNIPGISTVEQQIGRAEEGEDTFPPSESEFHVELQAVDGKEEERILSDIRGVLASYPGLETEALTFLGDRIGESLSGETAAIAISVFGADLDAIDVVAARIASVVRATEGTVDVRVQTPPSAPVLSIALDPAALALRGISAGDAFDAIEVANQGKVVAQVTDGQRVRDVAVVVRPPGASDPEAAGAIQVRGAGGALVALDTVADVSMAARRAEISHDAGRRRQVVTANAATADVAGLTRRVREAVAAQVDLPAGAYLEYAGAAEGEALARRELLMNAGVSAIGIVVLLVLAFGGGRPAALILSSVPSALAGGVLAVMLTGGVVSLGALVGFVTLFGIAARNAILLVSHTDHLMEEESLASTAETVMRAASERLVPILMTALVTALGMVPLALGSGEAGREVQGPMAQVILGGLATSTVICLILLPPLILVYRHRGYHAADDSASVTTGA
ncbi:MAG: efflux RND transporter permease subunit [Pseudomonadales bacterium]|jgi:CzcA family heavy metal efflux pump